MGPTANASGKAAAKCCNLCAWSWGLVLSERTFLAAVALNTDYSKQRYNVHAGVDADLGIARMQTITPSSY